MVMIMSGTQMPTQESLNSFKHVFTDYAKAQRVETFLGSHPDILINSLTAMGDVRTLSDQEPPAADERCAGWPLLGHHARVR